jgi:beta-glucosidase
MHVENGTIPMSELGTSVILILTEKFYLGLFDDLYVDPEQANRIVDCEAHRTVAYRAAAESMILLKNDNNFLPIDKNRYKAIALIGQGKRI